MVKIRTGNKVRAIKNREARGFTLIEVLVVIVIISILAAISIVTYNHIQARANNSQRLEFARAHMNAIRLYIIEHSELPFLGSACLGSGYPTYDFSGGKGACGRIDNHANGEYGTRYENPALHASIAEYMNRSLAPPANPIIVADHSGTRTYSGVMYDRLKNETLEGEPLPAIMWFYLQGDTSCAGDVIEEYPESTDWRYVNSYRSNGNRVYSRCIYPIFLDN